MSIRINNLKSLMYLSFMQIFHLDIYFDALSQKLLKINNFKGNNLVVQFTVTKVSKEFDSIITSEYNN
jgi:hypothetical protein